MAGSSGAMQNSSLANTNLIDSATHHHHPTSACRSSASANLRTNFNNEDETSGILAGERRESSSCLLLSPSNPFRIFAISFLTHWIYPILILVTVCAFVFSSVYFSFLGSDGEEDSIRPFSILEVTRWLLFITILSEILIKWMARGFFVGSKFAFLRLPTDWMDIISLICIFLSIVIPWKGVEFIAASVALLKLIPIQTGSINGFIFLCSCAKKLIPVVCYGLIIVWIYGFVIFALFVKYQHPHQDHSEDREHLFVFGNGSTSTSDMDIDESLNIAQNLSPPTTNTTTAGIVDVNGAYHDPTILSKSGNFSRGFRLECLPTSFRSLSGSFIQATEMLTLRYASTLSVPPSGRKTLKMNGTMSSDDNDDDGGSDTCQYEILTLSIIETLVIISGTLPMLIMSFSALAHLFGNCNEKSKQAHYSEDESNSYHHRRASESQRSSCDQASSGRYPPSPPCFNLISMSSLCDCDYYFCCLANLQRRLHPVSSRLLSSSQFKVFVGFLVSTDFVCMLVWHFGPSPKSTEDIDFSTTSLIIYYWVQLCFILYTVEASFRWLALSSDQYWTSVWPAFDLTMVAIYWIGFIVLHLKSYQIYYPSLCGILMIRMLKIVPYWKSLEDSLKLMAVSVFRNRQNLFMIFLCSSSAILLKYAAFSLESRWTTQDLTLSLPHSFLESLSRLILFLPCCVIIVTSFWHASATLNSLPAGATPDTTRNPSISLYLSESQPCHDAPFHFDGSRRSINESLSPISVLSVPNGITHHNKFMFSQSPCGSNNGLLSSDTRSSIVSPSSDVLSPLLCVPNGGLNGHAHHNYNHSQTTQLEDEQEESIQLQIGSSPSSAVKRESFFHPRRQVSVEDIANLITALLVILATVNQCLNSVDKDDDKREITWKTLAPGRSMWLEVFFVLGIGAHIIYKLRLSRFARERFLQIATVFDFVVILAGSMELFTSGMGWLPPSLGENGSVHVFGECAKILSACRGLLILSRISWLQCVGSGLCSVIWKVIRYLAAFTFFWIIILMEFVEAQRMIQRQTNKGQLETNATSDINNATEGGSQHVLGNEEGKGEVTTLNPILLTVTMLLFLLSIATFLGFLRCQIGNLSQLTEQFMTKSQLTRRLHEDALRFQLNFSGYSLKSSANPGPARPTKGICVPMLFFVTNNRTFDIIVMTVILLDGIGITLEHFGTSERALILRKHYPAYMLFLYSFEIGAKLYGNRLRFFKSYWNVFDCGLVAVCIIDLFASHLSQSWLPLLVQNMRFLRILRLFQFHPFTFRAQIIRQLFKSIPRVAYPLGNSLLFYLSLYLAALAFHVTSSHILTDKLPYQPWLIIAASPFKTISFQYIMDAVGSPTTSSPFSTQRVFYTCGEILFYLIRTWTLINLTVILIIILCQHLTEENRLSSSRSRIGGGGGVSRSHSFNPDPDHDDHHGHGMGRDGADCEDRSSYMIPCISPDHIEIQPPTPSPSLHLANHNNNMNMSGPSTSTAIPPISSDNIDAIDKPNSSLYQTTTITSSEEINGCKVFYVEAMITTV